MHNANIISDEIIKVLNSDLLFFFFFDNSVANRPHEKIKLVTGSPISLFAGLHAS